MVKEVGVRNEAREIWGKRVEAKMNEIRIVSTPFVEVLLVLRK